jgi:tetratricopeptide (TPR) repeat protein
MKNGLAKAGCSIIASLTILAVIEGVDFVRWLVFGGYKPLFFDWKAGLCILAALWTMPKIGEWFEQREKRIQYMADRIRDIDTRLDALCKWESLSSVTDDDDDDDDAHEYEGLDEETKTEIIEYKKKIENGQVSLHYNLGVIFWNLAMTHYNAQHLIGYRKVAFWLRKAAGQNYDCESTLGDAYIKLKDYDKAMYWYLRSVKRGGKLVWIAEADIGDMYAKGQGVSQNHAEAARWWERSAEHGSMWSHLKLGELYAEGAEGVPKSDSEAYFHLYIASTSTEKDDPQTYSVKLRDEIEKRLGKYTLSKERKRADEWLAADKAKKKTVTPLPLPQ